VKMLARPAYVGADAKVIANSMTGTFEYEKGDVREIPDFNVFFRHNATYPYYSDAIWHLTQMRRWGQIPEHKPDSWYMDIARQVYRPDIYAVAARALIADGMWSRTQRRRWGQNPARKTDGWYRDIARQGCRPDICAVGARELPAEGKLAASDFRNCYSE